jgi:hypothetical protein
MICFHALRVGLGVLQAGAGRRGDQGEEDAPVLARRVLARQKAEQARGRHRDQPGDGEHRPRPRHDRAQHAAIHVTEALEVALDHRGQAAALRARLEDLRAQHRDERERDHARDPDRRGDRHAELAEQPPDVALDERDRQEHGHEHERGGDDREADLAAAVHRGEQRRLAFLHASPDVLQHHDGVVHHQADREHEAEQDEDVDGIAEQRHHREGRDDADGDGQRGHERGADVPQEQVDDQQHEREGEAERLEHLEHRRLDERGAVEVDAQLDALRQRRQDFLHGGANPARDLHGVRLGLLLDAEADGRDHVGARRAALVLGADTHVRDVAEAHEVAVSAAPDDQRREVLGAHQARARAQRELALRRLEPARRELDVLAPERCGDVFRGDAARGHRLAVQPQAHGVAPRPPSCTRATPSTTEKRSISMRSAMSVSSSVEWRSLVKVSHMTGCVSLSAFAICGGSASGGSWESTRPTRSRTSFAASSTLRFSENSSVTVERSSRLVEVSFWMPSSPATWSSMTCVTRVSMTSADAPR